MKREKLCTFIAALCTLRPASVLTIPTHLRDAVQTVTIRIWHRESFEGRTHALHVRRYAEQGKMRGDDALEDSNKECV